MSEANAGPSATQTGEPGKPAEMPSGAEGLSSGGNKAGEPGRPGVWERLERSQNRGFLIAVGIGATLVLFLITAPFMFGAERLIRWGGEALTGFDVRIDGGGDLSLFPVLRLTAEDVIFTLPSERFQPLSVPPVARIARLDMTLSRWALLSGRIHAATLTVVRPQIRLDRDTNGRRNWAVADAPVIGDAPATVGGTDPWLGFGLSEVSVDGGTLRYTDARLDEDLVLSDLRLDGLLDKTPPAGAVFRLRADGRIAGDPVYLQGEVERIGQLPRGKRAPVSVEIVAGSGRAVLSGSMAFRQGTVLTAGLRLEHDDIRQLAPLFASGAAADGALQPLDIEATLDLRPDVLEVKDLKLFTTGSDLSGSLRISWDRRPKMEAEIAAGSLHLGHLAAIGQAAGVLPGGVDRARLDGEARMTWQRLAVQDIVTGPGTAAFSWSAGRPNLAGVIRRTELFGGQVDGEGTLTTSEGRTAVQGDLNVNGLALGRLLQEVSSAQGLEGDLSADITLLGVGETVEEILTASAGSATLAVRGGSLFGSRFVDTVTDDRAVAFDRLTADLILGGGVARSGNLVIEGTANPINGSFDWNLLENRLSVEAFSGPVLDRQQIELSGEFADLMFAR